MWIRRCSEKKWVQSWLKNQRQKPKNRSRNIIRFNPRFNKAVLTNIAKIFLRMINRHFPKSHRLHRIFIRNTVKVSYSCMQNMSKTYKGHNGKITSAPCNQLTLCNCQEKGECLMGGKMPNYGCSLWLSCHFSRATLKDNWFNDSFICKTIT